MRATLALTVRSATLARTVRSFQQGAAAFAASPRPG
jgi:hypothetical protein